MAGIITKNRKMTAVGCHVDLDPIWILILIIFMVFIIWVFKCYEKVCSIAHKRRFVRLRGVRIGTLRWPQAGGTLRWSQLLNSCFGG